MAGWQEYIHTHEYRWWYHLISLKSRVILLKREFLGCETAVRKRARGKPQSHVQKKIACIAAHKFTIQWTWKMPLINYNPHVDGTAQHLQIA